MCHSGEFPNADEFSAPFGRMNSMEPSLFYSFLFSIFCLTEVICLLGTYVLSIPAGVLGAAFHDTWTCGIELVAS